MDVQLASPRRRAFLGGLAGILAAGVAPSIITTPKLLMPLAPIPPEFSAWTHIGETGNGHVFSMWLNIKTDTAALTVREPFVWSVASEDGRVLVRTAA
jgi:hypothetical protein